MTKLFLHIGHPKTGSSAIQVACARSTTELATHGIHYPHHSSTSLALAGRFTAGNLTLRRFLDEYKTALAATPTDSNLFYSCEGLFDDLAENRSQIEHLKKSGVDISILLFLRNPIEFALSLYQQRVKGQGYTQTLSHFLQDFDQLSQIEVVLDKIQNLGIQLTLHKFETNKSQIIDLTEQWLGLPSGVLARIEKTVNRSATLSEQTFLREMSARLGPSSSDHIGRALADNLPDIPQELPPLSRANYNQFITKLQPQVQRLNARLPNHLHYQITSYEALYPTPPVEDHVMFSREQITVIVEALATRTPDADLATEFVRWVKNTEEGNALSAQDILRLNRLGQTLRPGNFPEQRMNRLRNRARQSQINQTKT